MLLLASRLPQFHRLGTPVPSAGQAEVTETVRVGDPSLLGIPEEELAEIVTDPSEVAGGKVTFHLYTPDQNERPAKGIPIDVTGPVNKTVTTDESGKATIIGPLGEYAFAVKVGCQGDLLIRYGGNAVRGVPQSAKIDVTLPVRWEHKIAPGGNSDSSSFPTWPIGKTIKVTFDVHDRCEESLAPPGSQFQTWRFRTNAILQIVTHPRLVADQNSKSAMEVRCVRAGEPTLIGFDAENEFDDFDLIEHQLANKVHSGQGRTQCE